MKNKAIGIFITGFCLLSVIFFQSTNFAKKSDSKKRVRKVLIVDGQNNHKIWPKTTMMMKRYLEQTGLFTVEIARTTHLWQGGTDEPLQDNDFKPDFSSYDVVISNFGWRAASWPKKTQLAFEQFVKKGGGLVVVHAANNSFPEWEEYNKMIGLGGWGNRNEKSGPYLYCDETGKLVKDTSAGTAGSHGSEQEFLITLRDTLHPVTRGMPVQWMHAQDELYDRLRGPAENVGVLATAFSDAEKNASLWSALKGTNHHEPMVLCLSYGKGRVFHVALGHADYSMECVGFIVLLQRGTEWAACGKVTQKIPVDFPTATKVSVRKWNP